ncbi:MAG TPA: hypothetical protein VEI73_16610 [Candidatus Acidoferrum sp.]|nr:hypothetical protein [Candidatus Acidoferrum sp.]
MKLSWSIGYWFLIAALFIEAMSLGHLTSAEYSLGIVFGFKRAYPETFWFHVLSGLFVCLLGFFTTATVLLHRPWSKRMVAVFCCVTILYISVRALSTQGLNWSQALEFCFLPIAALGYLALTWSKMDLSEVSHSS